MSSQDFIGTWKLISFEQISINDVTRPLGETPVGYLIYTPDGYMAVFLAKKDRSKARSDDYGATTVEEQLSAVRSFSSYCGRFEIIGDTVVHHVEVSLFPNWRGGMLEQYYKFEGNQLILTTIPSLFSGKMRTSLIIWEKV